MPRFDISTIGEGQIRLTCHKGDRLVTARELRMTAACSEANVSGLLSQLGRSASWASVMPRGELGERVLDEFRSVGVHLGNIVRTERGRVALYFMEPGEYPMPAKVIYDRLYTPFRDAGIEDFDWESMLDARLVFVTGITAALTENTARVVGYFVDQAAERGIDVALDGERPVGWVCTRMHPEDSMGEVYILAVDPPWQRRGIGRRLIERAESRTRGLGMRMLMVETGGDPGHAPARATYEAAGFERWPVARYFKDLSGRSDAAQARRPSARTDVP